MAGHAARHGARKRTAAAASVLESFAVAGGALSVVALMTFIAGGPARVDGRVTGDSGGANVSTGTPSPQGSSSAGLGPAAPAAPISTSPADVSAALPTGVPTPQPSGAVAANPADAAAPASPPTTTPGPASPPGSTTPSARPTDAGKPTKPPKPVPSGKPSVRGTPPVTPGIPPRSQPGPTP